MSKVTFQFSSLIVLFSMTMVCTSVFAVQIVGHRGASYDAPENTLASVQLAWKQDADAAEVDVYLTKDRKIVVIHDETTKRTGSIELKVNETEADILRRLDVGRYKDEKYTGEKIPFLKEIIETIPPGKELFIEIKCKQEILPYLKKLIESCGKTSQIVIIAFELDTITAAERMMPQIPTYWLKGTEKKEETDEYIAHSTDLIEVALAGRLDGLDVNYHGVTREFAEAVKAAGLELHVWTVNDLDVARRLVDFGVDGITTDRPGWLKRHLNQSGN